MSTSYFLSKLRKGVGYSTCSVMPIRPMLSVLIGVLIALQLVSTVASASSSSSSTASAYTFGNNQPLDQASVSVVRLIATYTPTIVPTVPPAPPCSATTVTGLGVLVGSWLTTTGGTDYTNWVMSDGSLINPAGLSCGTSKTTATLSVIQIYANDAYTNASGNPSNALLKTLQCTVANCGNGTPATPITCQVSPCANGIVLLPFHTTVPQPFVDMSTADQATPAPFGIGLASPTPSTITPVPTQAAQLLTPMVISNTSDPKNEMGMPIVNSLGQLQDVNTKAVDTGGAIRGYVTSQLTPGQGTHTNSLHDTWNAGITDYYKADYADAATAFRNAGGHNQIFRAGVAFWTLATNKASPGANSGSGTPTTSKTPGASHTPTARTGNINLFGVSIPDNIFTWIVAGLLILLVIILLLVTYAFIRKQMRQRKEYAKLERIADAHATQIAQQEKEENLQRQQGWQSPQATTNSPVNSAPPFVPLMPQTQPQSQPQPRPISAPLPVVSQQSPSPSPGLVPSGGISDLPTEEIPWNSGQNGNEKTTPLIIRNSTPRSAPPVEQFIGRNLGLIVGTSSNPGIKRQHKPNEDSLFAAEGMLNNNTQAPQFGLFVIADGMGGHANGQEASRLAIKTITETLMPRLTGNEAFSNDDFAKLLADGVQQANQAVHERNMEHHADMGTTMTATLVVGSIAYMANVGDSRTYLYRLPDGLKKVTNDHSVVASLVEAGIIKPDDIYTHPKRNQIYRSLGEKPVVDVDTFRVPLQPGDKIVLCSDGLWDMVRDPIIENVLNTVPDPTLTRHALIQAALDGGGEDNVSVIVVHIADSPQGGLSSVQVLAQPEAPQYPPM